MRSKCEIFPASPVNKKPKDHSSDEEDSSSAAKRRSCFKKFGNIQQKESIAHIKKDSFSIRPSVIAEAPPPAKSFYHYNSIINGNALSDNSSAEGKAQSIAKRKSSINQVAPEQTYGMARLTPKL